MDQITEDKDRDEGYNGGRDFGNSQQAEKRKDDTDDQPHVGTGNYQKMHRACISEHIVNVFGNVSGFAQQESGKERFVIAGEGLVKHPQYPFSQWDDYFGQEHTARFLAQDLSLICLGQGYNAMDSLSAKILFVIKRPWISYGRWFI